VGGGGGFDFEGGGGGGGVDAFVDGKATVSSDEVSGRGAFGPRGTGDLQLSEEDPEVLEAAGSAGGCASEVETGSQASP
jgi:hypothetical protein